MEVVRVPYNRADGARGIKLRLATEPESVRFNAGGYGSAISYNYRCDFCVLGYPHSEGVHDMSVSNKVEG